MSKKRVFRFFAGTALIAACSAPGVVWAETQDFGGFRYGGGGDKTAPRCQLSHPLSATSTFFITWFCVDDLIEKGFFEDGILTSIWIRRPNSQRFTKIDDFLDFPASLQVDEFILQDSFENGLPATFVLVANDRAGNTSISEPFTITSRNNDVDQCSLDISTRATEADGSTTGIPSLSVSLSNVNVFSQSASNNSFTLSMFREESASPCEISELCDEDDGNEVQFTASVTVDEDGSAEGRVNIEPGDLAVSLTGMGSISNSVLDSVELTGTTTVDGVVADVTLSCLQGAASTNGGVGVGSNMTDN